MTVLPLGAPGGAQGASTGDSTIGATVAAATSIDPAGCAQGTPDVTEFGTVLGGTSSVTTDDCVIVFGSTNSTSMLKAYQSDGADDSMVAGPTTTALGYWPLNGTGEDLSATGNDVTMVAPPADSGWAAGVTGRGQSAEFDGDDRATIPTHAAYDVTSFTVDLWVRQNSDFHVIATRAVTHCGNGGPLCQWEFYVFGGGLLEANLQVGAVQHSTTSAVDVADGAWHHVAFTVDDATKVARLYVDGSLAATDTTWAAGSVNTGAIPITLGDTTSGIAPYDGDLDELRIQAGARTAEEIRSYYLGRVEEYADSSNDWDTAAAATRLFGACLSSVANDAFTDGTTWTASAGCPASDGAWWKPLQPTAGSAGTKVAAGPSGDDDATANLRFGLRIPQTQPPGYYSAPVTFEVLAPSI